MKAKLDRTGHWVTVNLGSRMGRDVIRSSSNMSLEYILYVNSRSRRLSLHDTG